MPGNGRGSAVTDMVSLPQRSASLAHPGKFVVMAAGTLDVADDFVDHGTFRPGVPAIPASAINQTPGERS